MRIKLLEIWKNKVYLFVVFALIALGIIARSYYFFSHQYLYMDDASLAMNIISRDFFGLFTTLDYCQKSPPLFLVSTWIIYHIFGISEFGFRFIPFVSSVVSVFLFFKIAEKFLSNKISVLFALFLFAVNSKLIYYAQAFKQYSSDVLIALLLLYFYIIFDSAEKKNYALFGLIIGILALFSYPVLFVFPIIVLLLLLNNFNKKTFINLCVLSVPFAIVSAYYLLQAHGADSTQQDLIYLWKNIELCGFFSKDISSNILTIKNNILYFFEFCNFKLIILMILSGFLSFFLTNRNKFYLISGIFVLSVIASILKIYPFSERTILFLLPLIILLISKNLDWFSLKKGVSYIILLFMMTSFVNYNFHYFEKMYTMKLNIQITSEDKHIREIFEDVCKNMKEDDVYIDIRHNSIVKYYFKYYGKEDAEIIAPDINFSDTGFEKEEYMDWLKSCDKNKTYWLFSFYLPYLNQIDTYTNEYLTKNNIPFETKNLGENYLFYKFTL